MGAFAGRNRNGLVAFILCCLLAVYGSWIFTPSVHQVHAQEGEAAPAEGGGEAKPEGNKSLFIHIIESAGIVFGGGFLILSIIMVALVVLLAMDLRMGIAIPPAFVEEFTDTINKRRFKEAFEMARGDASFLARVMTTGMSRLQYGIEDAREAAFNMVESLKSSKDNLITYLATLGTLGPLIGLVGTVWGMILAFMTLSTSGGSPNAQQLAKDISHALVITLLGIGLSVPSIFFHAFFKNRLTRITMDTANLADDLLTQMYHNSKKPAAPAAAAPAAAADPRAAAAVKPAQ